jgi:Kelch motif
MAGTWQPLTNQPPFQACTMLLLTDGSVFVNGYQSTQNWKLVPDSDGSYVNGTWVRLADMLTTRLYYASAVLADGRVFVAGGEYSTSGGDTKDVEIYDPVWNTWKTINAPVGWNNIGDAPCCMLADGRVLLGSIFTTETAIFDPATDTFGAGPNKADTSSEETWTLLPDSTVLVAECNNHPQAEKYVPSSNTWVSAGTVPEDLVQASSIEIGPALVLPDGTAFCVGATGTTDIYTPPANPSQPGTWTQGPTFPADGTGQPREAKDTPGVLLPNGRVLVTVGPGVDGFNLGATFYEYDPIAKSLTQVPTPTNAGGNPYNMRMLLLPTGQVLASASSGDIEVYTPDGDPEEDWRPVITSVPSHLRNKQTYQLMGKRLNGLSQACSFGDDATMASNYPIVKIRSDVDGKEYYCRTFDHSTMGIATGNAIVSTHFKVPFNVPHGKADLVVIANGIASEPVDVRIRPWRLHFPFDEAMYNNLIGSLADGPLWVLGPHGPIPVDPQGPLGKDAKAAWAQLMKDAQTLVTLGEKAAKRQAAEKAPVHKPIKKQATLREAAGAKRV